MRHPLALLHEAHQKLQAGKPADAQQLIEAELSHDQKQTAILHALRATIDGNSYCYLRDVYDDAVVYEVGGGAQGKAAGCFRRTYSVDQAGKVTLGEPERVRAVMSYEPVSEAARTEPAQPKPVSGGLALGPTPAKGDATQEAVVPLQPGELLVESVSPPSEADVSLLEGAAEAPRPLLKLIGPGWGSSGYYSAEVLKRDGPQVLAEGLHNYWNHPTKSEESERPEGDINRLASVLTENARWLDQGPDGPGLYARAKVFSDYAQALREKAPHIGVSIRLYGKKVDGEAEGRRGKIVERLYKSRLGSADYVSVAGAGGSVLLTEAARPGSPSTSTEQGDVPMADKPLSEAGKTGGGQGGASMQESALVESLNDKVTGLRTENKTLHEQLTEARTRESSLVIENQSLRAKLAVEDCKGLIREAAKLREVPDFLLERQLETIPRDLKLRDGKLDEEAVKPLIERRIAEDMAFFAKATGSGQVRGMGAGGAETFTSEQAEKILNESYRASGMDPRIAEMAARGRKG